jgi:hypothetical protein
MLKLKNAINKIDLQRHKNALSDVQNCVTSIFIIEVEKFISLFDSMLLSVSELQDHKIKTMNLAKPIASIALSGRKMAAVQKEINTNMNMFK